MNIADAIGYECVESGYINCTLCKYNQRNTCLKFIHGTVMSNSHLCRYAKYHIPVTLEYIVIDKHTSSYQ